MALFDNETMWAILMGFLFAMPATFLTLGVMFFPFRRLFRFLKEVISACVGAYTALLVTLALLIFLCAILKQFFLMLLLIGKFAWDVVMPFILFLVLFAIGVGILTLMLGTAVYGWLGVFDMMVNYTLLWYGQDVLWDPVLLEMEWEVLELEEWEPVEMTFEPEDWETDL